MKYLVISGFAFQRTGVNTRSRRSTRFVVVKTVITRERVPDAEVQCMRACVHECENETGGEGALRHKRVYIRGKFS